MREETQLEPVDSGSQEQETYEMVVLTTDGRGHTIHGAVSWAVVALYVNPNPAHEHDASQPSAITLQGPPRLVIDTASDDERTVIFNFDNVVSFDFSRAMLRRRKADVRPIHAVDGVVDGEVVDGD